jgi:hypothetical protein
MSDQQAPTPAVDTPAVAGPTEAPGTAQDQPQDGVSYEQRYKDLQAEYTRSQQAFKEAQEREQWYQALVTSDDPDIHRQAADILGLEIPDDEEYVEGFEPEGYEDPTEQLQQRLNALEEQLNSRTQQERQQVEQEFTSAYAHDQLDELGVDAEDMEFRQLVFERALSLPRLRPLPGMPVEGLVDVKSAYEQIKAYEDNRMQRWAKTKRAPYVPAGGQSANEVPDSGTGHEARMARAARFLFNNQGDEQ